MPCAPDPSHPGSPALDLLQYICVYEESQKQRLHSRQVSGELTREEASLFDEVLADLCS